MRRATREARTLAISAHAAAVAARAVANILPRTYRIGTRPAQPWPLRTLVADLAEQEADRYWLRLARTLRGKG